MILGLDYSAGRPGGKAIKDAGYQFVVRYLSDGGPGLPGKLLTPQEADDLLSNSVAIAVVWETVAQRILGGQDAGAADARAAVAQIARCGGPDDRPVYFAADWDATPQQQDPIDDYLRGAADVIGVERVGVYGGYWPLSRAKTEETERWFWQTGAWSGGLQAPNPNAPGDWPHRPQPVPFLDTQVYQRPGQYVTVGGVSCDVNEARVDDYGQWPAPPDPGQLA